MFLWLRWESNPHGPFGPPELKSDVSTIPPLSLIGGPCRI